MQLSLQGKGIKGYREIDIVEEEKVKFPKIHI